MSKTWPKHDILKGKGSLTSPPHITFGPRFLPSPNVAHAAKLTMPITIPKLTQENLEQARSRLNILKISSQAHTQAPKFDPRFWKSKNMTSPHTTSRPHLSHVWPSPNVRKATHPKLSPLNTQGHVWTKFQTWPKRDFHSLSQGP
ncbi:hypothetical protein PIB30_088524 [Stylosanthes scabra]|uniref:Uncharacterized protein n=1 Tax=Stylosanthes scabra TaxID=79078 RepID=A0ABU6QT63_9FABA|nr:hypothetical protein [Stylosanthes scabra]